MPDRGLSVAIDAAIADPAGDLVADYFDDEGPFAAATFDTIGCNDPFKISTDDLLAVTLLDVSVPARAVRQILDRDALAISTSLAAIPEGRDLWHALDADLAAANALWQRLDGYPGVGSVIAGKLLARKRPRLIPIVDDVVIRNMPAPEGEYWNTLRTCLDSNRVAQIEQLRRKLPRTISTLRLLDVAVWMRFSDGRNARRAQAKAGLAVLPRTR